MKIIIDSAIPYLEGLFEPFANVEYINGTEFTPERVKDADALIIRTRTRCNRELLEGSSVRIIATATIGYDHIDLEYCRENNIEVATAAGCNARAVLQWVGAALAYTSRHEGWSPQERILGVVGVGNVGRLVAEYGRKWGFEVICCDPPRAENEEGFIEFEELIARADIISFHTPLDSSTHHMLNSANISLTKDNALIINSSRGEVIESAALKSRESANIILDVWESEPSIDIALLDKATLATPHIAGYSAQGKANGSAMSVHSVARKLALPLTQWHPNVTLNAGHEIEWCEMCETITQHFDIETTSHKLKNSPESFEQMRNDYAYREEYF